VVISSVSSGGGNELEMSGLKCMNSKKKVRIWVRSVERVGGRKRVGLLTSRLKRLEEAHGSCKVHVWKGREEKSIGVCA